jgi:uncharacterized membrane protein (UPF0182 family)
MELLQVLRQRWWLVLGVVVILLLALSTRLATFYTDVLWFRSIGFDQVFWALLTTQFGLAIVAGLILTVLLAGNLMLARRLAPRYRIPSSAEESVERYRQLIEPIARPLLITVSAVVGVLSGLSVAPEWPRYVMWANATAFGRTDPQFNRDLGYFVFELPFQTLVYSWLFTALVITVLMTLVAHYVFGGIRPQAVGQRLTPQVNVHLSVLLAALVAVRAWGFWLDRYLLSYSERGQVTGLSYTDVHATLGALGLLTIISVICVALFLLNIRFRGWLLPAAGVAILLILTVVLSGIIPAIIQRIQVDPQELPREREYIDRNLEMTRFAFNLGLDEVAFEDFPANAELTDQQVADNQTTLESIRLWDPATLQNTYQQLQELRPYYDFRDVDVDRYDLGGDDLQQVMLSVREVATTDLPAQARTWQNQAMVYTHGYGLVSSSVSTRRRDGQPVFLVDNIPPRGVPELLVENPRIYFGEAPPPYSIVGTTEDELDYDLGEGQPVERFRYGGEDGIPVDSLLRRFAFALRFAEPNILLSGLITDDSRIMYNRHVRERVQDVAPYLKLDHDAYPAAVDGRVKWILDAYATTDMMPYSERIDLASATVSEQQVLQAVAEDGQITLQEQSQQVPGLRGTANYIRNSVKAVVDAYDGTVTLYVVDPDDPLIQTWRKAFPDSFTDVEEASDQLRAHFRYPEDMFRVQAMMFETYHIPTAEAFYNKDDAWNVPLDAQFLANNPDSQENRTMRPYYLLMRLPGEENEEFALIQPFTPEGRNNLIGWLAGRSDGQNYGQLKAFRMPPTKTVFGPEQIQARINQDDAVSQQITLWNQSGSRVRYGNLLVIPIEDSLLYAQPLFLRAEQSEIPELRRTVLVFGDQVVMEPTLQEALAAVFGPASPGVDLPEGAEAPAEGEEPPEAPSGEQLADPAVAAALDRAIAAFDAADQALADGDLGEYQRQTAEAEAALREVQRLLGEAAAPDEAAPSEPVASEPAAAASEP